MRGAVVVLAAAICVLSGGSSGAAPSQSVATIECRTYWRPSVTQDVRSGPVFRLTGRRALTSRAGPFGFRATVGEDGNARIEALSVRVWNRRSGKSIASTLHQFRTSRRPAAFAGGHGFTGLVYTYTPSGAELQYFCRAL